MWATVPRLWPGETVVIAASGPSLTVDQLSAVRGRARLIVINSTWQLAPWADMLYACDHEWWLHEDNRGAWDFAGLKVSQDVGWVDPKTGPRPQPPNLHIVASVAGKGLSLDPARIHRGANGGYQALNLGMHLSGGLTVFLGLDMKMGPGNRPHHHADHRCKQNPSSSTMETWRKNFETTLPDLKTAGVEVINCTPGSALQCFPQKPLCEVFP